MSYESQSLLHQYLLFHYGTDTQNLPWDFGPKSALHFPVRTVTELLDLTNANPQRALDIGCAVGRSAFELSKHCTQVTAIDYSATFIQAAETLRTKGTLDYQIHEQASHYTPETAARPATSRPDRITFQTGDACHLPDNLGTFDIIHAANLICRLPDPEAFLKKLKDLTTPGAQLAITTPATWLEEYTPKTKWPKTQTLDLLKDHLTPHFDLIQTKDLPFLIRETARKYQWTVAQGTTWRRK